MTEATDIRVHLVTAPDEGTAKQLARNLVESGLAACVNVVGGVTSIYKWQGALEEQRETLLIIKSSESASASLTERVRELHPYDVPEVLALPAVGGNGDYLDWVRSESKP